MKKLSTILSIFVSTILLITSVSYADCRGCCSSHGGVVCTNGVTKCCDGTPLSDKCKAKGCNKCEPAFTFSCNGHVAYGIPGPDDQFLCREGYAVGYDYDTKVPTWVAYRLTPESVNKKFERSNKFKEDIEIPPIYRSVLSDYKGSGYDRGHMVASATVDFSYNAMMESFLLSNIAPQLPGLNRQGWKYLEAYVREWVNERGELYVVTGTLFVDSHDVIGNGVHIPTHFYKVIFDPVTMDVIAFLVPHRPISKSELPEFIVSVDEVELQTGLDFNNFLDDALEDDIENDVEGMW